MEINFIFVTRRRYRILPAIFVKDDESRVAVAPIGRALSRAIINKTTKYLPRNVAEARRRFTSCCARFPKEVATSQDRRISITPASLSVNTRRCTGAGRCKSARRG